MRLPHRLVRAVQLQANAGPGQKTQKKFKGDKNKTVKH
jgi:hypothetical protein